MRSNKYNGYFIKIVKKFVDSYNYEMIGNLIHRAITLHELSLMDIIELAKIIEKDINNCLSVGGTTIFDYRLYYRQDKGEWVKDWSYGGITEAR
jgi:hypothetical protein